MKMNGKKVSYCFSTIVLLDQSLCNDNKKPIVVKIKSYGLIEPAVKLGIRKNFLGFM